jgi:hypothetical protein
MKQTRLRQNCCLCRSSGLSEQLINGVGSLLPKLGQNVRVGIHRDADLGVTKHLHDGAR